MLRELIGGHYLFHRGALCPPGLGLSVANSTLPALPPRKPRAAQQATHTLITKNVNYAHINQRQLKLFAAISWTNSGNRKRLKAFMSTKPSRSHLIYPPTRSPRTCYTKRKNRATDSESDGGLGITSGFRRDPKALFLALFKHTEFGRVAGN